MLHYMRSAITSSVRSRVKSERGATAVEYGLLVVLIAAVIIVAVASIGTKIGAGFDKVDTQLGGTPAL